VAFGGAIVARRRQRAGDGQTPLCIEGVERGGAEIWVDGNPAQRGLSAFALLAARASGFVRGVFDARCGAFDWLWPHRPLTASRRRREKSRLLLEEPRLPMALTPGSTGTQFKHSPAAVQWFSQSSLRKVGRRHFIFVK